MAGEDPENWGVKQLARFDLYDPYSGGFRAPLAADFGTGANGGDLGMLWAVGLDANGRVVKGGGQTGVLGILILTMEKYALQPVDIMTDGQIVDINTSTSPYDNFYNGATATAAVAGKAYYANATNGRVDVVAPAAGAAGVYLGNTVEKNRLIVRVGRATTPA